MHLPVDALRDHRPPAWLVHLLRRRDVRVRPEAVLRAVLILGLPLAVGFATGHPEWGALASTGGLPTVLGDERGSYRRRALRLAAVAAAACVGFGIGIAVQGTAALATPVILVVAVLSVPLGRAAKASGPVGMMLLMYAVIGAGLRFAGTAEAAMLAAFGLGVGWGLAVTLAGWAVRPTSPERASVAAVFVQLATMLDADDAATARAARQQLTVALNTAYDRLLTARTWLASRHSTYRGLLTLLTQATPLVEASTAAATAGARVPTTLVRHLTAVAAAVLARAPLPDPPERGTDDPVLVAAIHDGLRRLQGGRSETPEGPAAPRSWWSERLDELRVDRVTANATLRVGVCVALAEAVGLVLPMPHVHWVTLTVAIVLRPELGSVFGRTMLRAIGTVGGVAVGALVLLAEPGGWPLAALAAVFAAGVAVGKALNLALLTTAMTPLIIVQLDIQNLGDPAVLTERLAHTALGCGIVLVFGYWLWPGSLRPRVGARVAETLDAVGTYVDRGLRLAPGTDDPACSQARRDAYRSLAELRTAFSQVIVEPSPAGRQALAWWPAIVGLERVTDAVTDAVVRIRNGADIGDDQEVTGIVLAIDELRDAVREGREPTRITRHGDGPLSKVTANLEAITDAIRGPDVR